MVAKLPSLVLYNPVLHEGYLRLYEKYGKKVAGLYILGEDLISEFPRSERELGRIDQKKMVKAIQALGLFKEVNILTKSKLAELEGTPLIANEHALTRWVLEKYLPKNKISYDTTFLRWDMPKALSQYPVNEDEVISQEAFDQEMIGLALKEAEKSDDWWRQVGAVIWKDGKVIATGHNHHLPSPEILSVEGDPRSWLDAGTHPEIYTSIHGEQAAIATAARLGTSLEGASIYLSTFPCPTCANLIAFAGIEKCYFQTGYSLLNGRRVLDAFKVKVIRVTLPQSED